MSTLPLRLATLTTLTAALLLAGCDSGSSGTAATDTSVTVNGSAVAGPVDGQLQVRDAAGNTVANATVTQGSFRVRLTQAQCAQELDFAVTGSYTDEVSGSPVQLSASHPLAARSAAGAFCGSASNDLGVTPASSVIRAMVEEGGLTLTQAQVIFQSTFGSLPDSAALPFDPTQAEPADVDDARRLAAFMVGAYSQWANELGLTGDALATLPAQLAADLADGSLDGIGADGNPVALGSTTLAALNDQSRLLARYLTAMANFAGGSDNGAGLSAPSEGLPTAEVSEAMTPAEPAERTLTLASGSVLTLKMHVDNPAPMADQPMVSYNRHQLVITDASDQPVDLSTWGGSAGLQIAMKMHMLSGMSHATTFDPDYIAAESTPITGLYAFDAYYLMATSSAASGGGMGSGEMSGSGSASAGQPLGVWDLEVKLTEADGTLHSVIFHPEVVAPSDGSNYQSRKSNSSLGGPVFLWYHDASVNVSGSYNLGLALSTKQNMMSFPLLQVGTLLGSGATVTGISVKLDADNDGSYETDMVGAAGLYRASNLTLNGDESGFVTVAAQVTLTTDADGNDTTSDDVSVLPLSGYSLTFKLPPALVVAY